jgi:Domain of unknown function (DUF4823)
MLHRLILLTSLTIAGCADTHELTRINVTTAPLSRDASAYIALPQDGRYGQILYRGSGAQTAQEVAAAFAPYFSTVSVATGIEDIATAVKYAQAGRYDYVFYPEILHWEDRATEWSGKPDLVSVKISIIQTRTGEIVDSGIIQGTSGLATFGGDHPQDLLPEALQQYAAALFGDRV